TLGSRQADALQNLTGSFGGIGNSTAVGMLTAGTGVFNTPNNSQFSDMAPSGVVNGRANTATFDASRVARTSTENRSVNGAYHPRIHA
ncbi:hypothetical protein ACOTI6_31115, partial [Achromobacter denitrificans]